MDISLDKKSNTAASIKISVKEQDYQQAFDKKVKDYSKQANIKGFRPGKVPAGYIKKLYGTSILVEEVNHIVSHKLSDYIREEKLRILGEPMPNQEATEKIDWEQQKDFEFIFDIGMVDDFEVPLNDKLKLTRLVVEPDAKEVEQTLDRLKQNHGETSEVEESAEEDVLSGKLSGQDLEEPKQAVLDLKQVEKKQQKAFVGKKKGESVEFDIKKLFKDSHDLSHFVNQPEEEAKKLKGKYSLEIERINRTVPAELNEEFFAKVLGPDRAKTEEEFRKEVIEEMKKAYAQDADQLLSMRLRDALIEKTEIELPDEFLLDWLSGAERVSREDAKENLETYKKQLRWNLIMSEIREQEDIKVEPDEVRQRAMQSFVSQFGGQLSPEMAQQLHGFIDEFLQKDNGKQYQEISSQILDDKVLAVAKEKITIKEKTVKGEEFRKEVEK